MKRWQQTLFLILALSFPMLLFAENKPCRVLCFGDSITQGTYIEGKYVINNSWVNILQDVSDGRLNTINAGLSGRKTSQKEELTDIIKVNCDIGMVIIFLGVNDLRVSKEEVLKECVSNIKWMVEKCREAYGNPKIVILSSPGLAVGNIKQAFYKLGFDEKEQAMLDKMRTAYNSFCKKNNCIFIDLWGVVSRENFTDGLHPDINGQRQIAGTVWEKLKTMEF